MEKDWAKFTSSRRVGRTWYSRDWGFFAYSFKQSADLVFEQYKNTRRDAFWFPAIFLYRQWLELALKSTWEEVKKFDSSFGAPPHVHNLKKLWLPLRSWMVTNNFFRSKDKYIESAERIFEVLDEIDPDSSGFRYPPLKSTHFDLINFSIEDFEIAIDQIDTVFFGIIAEMDRYEEFYLEAYRR